MIESIATRIRHMAIGWGSVAVGYFASSKLSKPPVVIPETWLDKAIGFDPIGVWLYLSFFILVPATYLTCERKHLMLLRNSMVVCAVVAATVFSIFPTTLTYPNFERSTVSSLLLGLVIEIDSSNNCLPSLHAALTLICAVCLVKRRALYRNIGLGILGLGILFAIIQTRRHLSIDITAGLLLGSSSMIACLFLLNRRPENWISPTSVDISGQ